MKKYQFKNAEFVKSAILPVDFPPFIDSRGAVLQEVAVVGRSNVGKSSLLQSLFAARNLVRISSTPGKTRMINFFTLNKELAFVDLPGYGYSVGTAESKADWEKMIEGYLKERQNLKLVLFLLDVRRVPSDDDVKMVEWLKWYKIPFGLVITKVDKVSLSERQVRTREIVRVLAAEEAPLVHYSVLKNEGREKLIHTITEALSC